MFEGDKYHLWVPIVDNELCKSIEVDENGDYIVQGVMTSDDKDEESDVIDPGGMDCSYFLEKGWIKYEHGNNPDQFIGEPLEIRLGTFKHPKLNKSIHGIFVKGRLFANRELARKAVQTIQDLQKSNTKRCMGWSIEGNVVERDRKTGKILKSVLRNVVLTMNPVNTMTWVELAKSFAKNHEVTISCEEVDKSLDTSGMAEIMPQSLEGAEPIEQPTELEHPTEEQQEKFIKLLRKMVEEFRLNKALALHMLDQPTAELEADVVRYANRHGLSNRESMLFAKYIAERHPLLKSMFIPDGGDKMSLLDILDEELEELRKSMAEDDEEEEEKDGDEEDEEEQGEGEEGEDEADSDEDSDEEEDEEDDEKTEKSFASPLRKSLSRQHRQAFEVSDFLSDMTDEIGFQLSGLQKSVTLTAKKQEKLLKSMATMLQSLQDLAAQVEALKEENATLQKSLDEVLSQPIGRKSVVSGREYQTLSKSANAQPASVNVREVLEKSFEAGELDGTELIRFENGVPLHMLNLPASVKRELGLL